MAGGTRIMRYRVEFNDEAKLDSKEITAYLAQFFASTPRNFKNQLANKIASLKKTPYICQPSEIDPFFRRIVVGDYNLYYSVDEQKKLVTIHRIFHHTRNISKEMLMN